MEEQLLSILKQEIKPALGCTGPTSVSFAAAAAKDLVGGKPGKVRIIMDKDGYKNSIAVGIPGTTLFGLEIAAALGALAGDSSYGLEVLKDAGAEDEKQAIEFLPKVSVEIKWDLQGVGLYNEAYVETENGVGHVIVRKTHTNIVFKEINGEVLFDKRNETGNTSTDLQMDYEKDAIRSYSVKDFYDYAGNCPLEEIEFLKEAITLNARLAEAGLEKKTGSDFGRTFNSLDTMGLITEIKAVTAAASDARMAGLKLPAMSCATSGNVGISSSLPLAIFSDRKNIGQEKLLRSLALSFLIVIYVKSHIGRLSAICACSIASSLGVAAGTTFLLGGSYRQVEHAINSVVGSIGGILCDGAKYGCAMKLAHSAGVAVESALMAMKGVSIRAGDGLVGDSADETIQAIGRIAQEGMIITDEVMARTIIEREQDRQRYSQTRS